MIYNSLKVENSRHHLTQNVTFFLIGFLPFCFCFWTDMAGAVEDSTINIVVVSYYYYYRPMTDPSAITQM